MAGSRLFIKDDGRDFRTSHCYQKLKAHGPELSTRINNIRHDFQNKATTQMINEHDYLAAEDLKGKNMPHSAKGTVTKLWKQVAQKRDPTVPWPKQELPPCWGMMKYKATTAGIHD